MFSFKTASRIGVALSVLGMLSVAAPASAEDHAAAVAALSGDAAKGKKTFKRKCGSCHFAEKDKKKTGPTLLQIFGRTAASVEGFKYSKAMTAKAEEGLVWNTETMTAYLTKPKDFVPKTRMSFAGFKDAQDIADVLAHLLEVSGETPAE